MTYLVFVLAVVAVALFVLATFDVVVKVRRKIELAPLGLAFLSAAYVAQYTVVGHLHYLHR